MKQYNFKNPDDFKELERQAYDGTIDVSRFPPAEYKYFDMLRKLYYAFKFDGLSKNEAEKQKHMLYADYAKNCRVHENYCNVYSTYQNNIRKIGTLLSDVEKAVTADDIAIKACTVIQLLTGDMSFAERQRKKLQ